ncbi:MAG: hypothetical protein MJE77_17535 [Proteobacteria bacterium]|nr:hypothetical protein [Pseudomonadota bacterium]
MSAESRVALKKLVASLQRLSASSDEQLAYLRSAGDGTCIDELALEFDDAYRGLGMLIRDGVVSSDVAEQITRLSERLDGMSGEAQEDLWDA